MADALESQAEPLVVRLEGDLGLADQERIAGLFPKPEYIEDRLVLDCSGVTSMDSAILALIMMYRRRVQMAGRDPLTTIVAIAPPRLMRLFELTGIARVITVVPSEEP